MRRGDLASCAFTFLGKEVRRLLFLPNQEGQGLIEYVLILVLIAMVVIIAAVATCLGAS